MDQYLPRAIHMLTAATLGATAFLELVHPCEQKDTSWSHYITHIIFGTSLIASGIIQMLQLSKKEKQKKNKNKLWFALIHFKMAFSNASNHQPHGSLALHDSLLQEGVVPHGRLRAGHKVVPGRRRSRVDSALFIFEILKGNCIMNNNQNFDKVIRLLNQLKGDINRKKAKLSEGKMSGMIEAEIKASISSLNQALEELRKTLERNSQQCLPKEQQRRQNMYLDLVNQKNQLLDQYKHTFTSGTGYNKKLNNSHMTNAELNQFKDDLMSQQEQQLDQAFLHTNSIKSHGQEMGIRITQQNKLLSNLEEEFDETNSQLSKTQKKMQTVMKKTPTWGLSLCILLEIVVLVLVIVLL